MYLIGHQVLKLQLKQDANDESHSNAQLDLFSSEFMSVAGNAGAGRLVRRDYLGWELFMIYRRQGTHCSQWEYMQNEMFWSAFLFVPLLVMTLGTWLVTNLIQWIVWVYRRTNSISTK